MRSLEPVSSSFRRFLVVNNFLDGATSNAELLYVASPERPAAAAEALPPPLESSDIEDDGTDAEEPSQAAAQPATDGAAPAEPVLAADTATDSDASDSEDVSEEGGEDSDGSQAAELPVAAPGLLSATEHPAAAAPAAGPALSPAADLAHDETMAEATADVVQTNGD
jgi:hypothetical protein